YEKKLSNRWWLGQHKKCENPCNIKQLRRNTGLMRSYENMIKILFVCHGNICRSPMAEFMFKDMAARRGMAENFYIESAATSREEIGNDIHRGTRGILEREGIPYCRRRARQVTRADYDN